MTNRFFKIVLFFGIFLILFGCAAQQPVKEFPPFKPIDLNSRIKSGDYLQKVDYFQVILDASATTKGQEYQTARHLAKTMNLTIPDLDLKAGLRVFGTSGNRTDLVYGMVNYTQLGFDSAIPLIGGFGESPLGDSIAAAGLDLKQASNNMALIIFSDGLETEASSIDAANDLKKQYGDRLCIYAVNLGSSPRGRGVLEGVTKAAQCGFVVKAEEIQSPEGMAGFVEKVFLAKAPPKPEPVVPSLPPVPRPPTPPQPQEVTQPVY
jgi:OOP family OmpA-OmpF porin